MAGRAGHREGERAKLLLVGLLAGGEVEAEPVRQGRKDRPLEGRQRLPDGLGLLPPDALELGDRRRDRGPDNLGLLILEVGDEREEAVGRRVAGPGEGKGVRDETDAGGEKDKASGTVSGALEADSPKGKQGPPPAH